MLLIIEAADGSLAFDRDDRADLYASAEIADDWVVNIPFACVDVFRQPQSGRYVSQQVVAAPGKTPQIGTMPVVMPP